MVITFDVINHYLKKRQGLQLNFSLTSIYMYFI